MAISRETYNPINPIDCAEFKTCQRKKEYEWGGKYTYTYRRKYTLQSRPPIRIRSLNKYLDRFGMQQMLIFGSGVENTCVGGAQTIVWPTRSGQKVVYTHTKATQERRQHQILPPTNLLKRFVCLWRLSLHSVYTVRGIVLMIERGPHTTGRRVRKVAQAATSRKLSTPTRPEKINPSGVSVFFVKKLALHHTEAKGGPARIKFWVGTWFFARPFPKRCTTRAPRFWIPTAFPSWRAWARLHGRNHLGNRQQQSHPNDNVVIKNWCRIPHALHRSRRGGEEEEKNGEHREPLITMRAR